MTPTDALELLQAGFWAAFMACAPAVGAAMTVGISIALFQALTQIQEATLTFVPKIFVTLLVIALTAAFIGSTIMRFSDAAYSRIESGFP